MRRFRIGIFLILMVASGASAATPPYGGQIVIAYYDEPSSLNPIVPTSGSAAIIESAFTNGLVKQNESGGVEPDLAESWDVSPDRLTWTFHLRKGVKFSDGADMTADDVAATFRYAIDPKSPSRTVLLSQLVRAVTSDGKLTVQLILNSPYSLLTQAIQRPIVPAGAIAGNAVVRKEYDAKPVGTGPFMLIEVSRDKVVLDANPNYFEGRPHLSRIVFKRFSDQKKAWTSLVQGGTDMVVDVDYEDYMIIKDDPRFTAYDYLDTFCYPLLFNLKDPLFSDLKLRQAISYAIDRQDLVDKALRGGGVPTTGTFQPGTWPYNPDPSIQPFDPARSVALLKDLGWKNTDGDWVLQKDGKKFQFTVLIDDSDELKAATAKRLQWQLLQVGIRMDVEAMPLGELLQGRLLAGKYQAAIMQMNTFSNPDVMTSVFWHSSAIGGNNLSGYANSEVDRLIATGKTATDADKKAAIYQQIHRLISNDIPAAFLYYRKRYTAMNARLKGFQTGPYGLFSASMSDWYVIR